MLAAASIQRSRSRWLTNSWPMMRSAHMPAMELGISETLKARPLQAAFASAASFVCAAARPFASPSWSRTRV